MTHTSCIFKQRFCYHIQKNSAVLCLYPKEQSICLILVKYHKFISSEIQTVLSLKRANLHCTELNLKHTDSSDIPNSFWFITVQWLVFVMEHYTLHFCVIIEKYNLLLQELYNHIFFLMQFTDTDIWQGQHCPNCCLQDSNCCCAGETRECHRDYDFTVKYPFEVPIYQTLKYIWFKGQLFLFAM